MFIKERQKENNKSMDYDWSVLNFFWTSRLSSNYDKRRWCIANQPTGNLLIYKTNA